MNKRNLIKARRVGEFLKVAPMMLKHDKWTPRYRSYCINGVHRFDRKELIMVIENNKRLLRELLK